MTTRTFTICLEDGTQSKNSLSDFGLAVSNTNYIGTPTQETYSVDVPGKRGILDLSEVLTGYPIFKNRQISLEVGAVKLQDNWDSFISSFRNTYEGRVCKIVFDNDTSWYWKGRVSINDFTRTGRLGTFTLLMDADAYKRKVTPTVDTYTVSSSQSVTLRTYTIPVVPVFKCTALTSTSMVVTVSQSGASRSYTLNLNEKFEVPGLDTTFGGNVNLTGTGTVTVTYEEMSL